ncbi:MBL fold metallo-hydrolase [Rathayibacter tanaceti]|uniref:MBL fold metallo-hydrolase n=2 Tax=Rathayibacter tanaceti TaxID=1671680 RepID=A0A166IG02_9MICO|nr:MBL fold metallo-hydrolase [Rathayibacter tanaceti]KZX22324.1 Metallo-beta-lactamase superfamily protein [Rathayibacter tanaceti]QHC56146.1 MBL fold metallo-hydrolase [Rathayibacter tanaceti]TCO36986.1 glyoxylase-like metal-dependent hydrolase (beta-lactamase superfamily II) [Rathayibacter tanaceti]
MNPNDLAVDVYVAPMRPFAGAPARGPGDDPMWSPMSSTLIAGAEEAILVDTLITRDQVDSLAGWVRGFGKRITGVYITHGHQDHWIGLARLQEHFPEARGIATPEIVERARFEATDPNVSAYWKASFPGELPRTPVLPEPLDGSEFELESRILRAVPVGQGDTEFSTVLHVPSVAAVIGGDVVYNGVHMMTAETDEQTREAWIASLESVADLKPKVVVAGHKSVGAPDRPEIIAASQQYLRDFSRIVNEDHGIEGIVHAMLELHGDRDNPRTLWHSARAAVARRG